MSREDFLNALNSEKEIRERLVYLFEHFPYDDLLSTMAPKDHMELINTERKRIAEINELIVTIESNPNIL